MYLLSLLVWISSVCFGQSVNSPELYAQFTKELASPNGVSVEVHGADHSNGLYVIAYRPKGFFDYVIISLQADYTSPNYLDVKKQLATLGRHDVIQIKGAENPLVSSHQSHVLISNLTIVSKFTPPMKDVGAYTHYTNVLKEITNKTELIVKVHASLVDGRVFMVEYGDANIPVVVPDNALTKDLYRGDKVKIHFKVQDAPPVPAHLVLDSGAKAVEMLDRIVEQHGQPQDRCGELVMFPQSSQVLFNVFAIKIDIGDNLFRTYTLINFDDPDLFMAFRDKAQAAWDAHPETAVAGRNYYINPNITACAKGLGNMIVPTQANPQIIINSVDDLTFQFTAK
ncbi:MAG: hypothetical protein H6623_04300 [Bdellovibrionaceae bacterium]|nr:hypothetical protein [Pseudobdellovibrionaceae bacterium]